MVVSCMEGLSCFWISTESFSKFFFNLYCSLSHSRGKFPTKQLSFFLLLLHTEKSRKSWYIYDVCILVRGLYRVWNISYTIKYCWNTGLCLANDVLNSRKWLCENGRKGNLLLLGRENEEKKVSANKGEWQRLNQRKVGIFTGMYGVWVKGACEFLNLVMPTFQMFNNLFNSFQFLVWSLYTFKPNQQEGKFN